MYAEVFAGFGVFVFLLFYLAEISNKKPVGVIASLLVLLFGVWLLTDNIIYVRSGEVNTLAHLTANTGQLNTTIYDTINGSTANLSITNGLEESLTATSGTVTGTETVTYSYTALDFSSLPIPLGQALAFIFIALGLYGFAAYSVDVFTTATKK